MTHATTRFATPDAILAHPDFPEARAVYVDAVMDLYEAKPLLLELMRDGGRIFVYGLIMAFWGAYREEAPETWPTVNRLKEAVGRFGMASPRQIDAILARFVQAGHLVVAPAGGDMRKRIVLPTPGLIEHDRAFIRAHYAPLGQLFGPGAYALPLAGDRAFLKAARAAWFAALGAMADDVILANRPLLRFYAASAGMLMLMKLVGLQGRAAGGVALDYSDFSRRFAVSRTHVRTLFTADDGLAFEPDGVVRVRPDLCAALDRNIAERLSLLDRCRLAAAAAVGA